MAESYVARFTADVSGRISGRGILLVSGSHKSESGAAMRLRINPTSNIAVLSTIESSTTT